MKIALFTFTDAFVKRLKCEYWCTRACTFSTHLKTRLGCAIRKKSFSRVFSLKSSPSCSEC